MNKEYVLIGKIASTHGIKGEIRILSDFDQKEKVFVPNFVLYFGPNYNKNIIDSYRHHKEYEMVTLKGFTNINEVLHFKGLNVYIKRDDLKLNEDEYLLNDLIGLNVIENQHLIGNIDDIVYNNTNILLSIKSKKDFYIPYNEHFIKSVDLNKQEVVVENTEGLIL